MDRPDPYSDLPVTHTVPAPPAVDCATRPPKHRADALTSLLDPSRLPTPPGLAMQVVRATSRPDCKPAEIVALLGQDPALCAQLLRAVNSSLYAPPQPISSLDRVVMLLGLHRLRSLVLGLSLPAMQFGDTSDPAVREYWLASVSGALIARDLAAVAGRPAPDDDLVAGLLRDLGVPLLQRSDPAAWQAVAARLSASPFEDRCVIEAEAFGIDHADLGAELLQRWNLPDDLVEPIRHHHRPGALSGARRELADRAELLYLAEFLAHLDTVVQQPRALARTLALAQTRFGLDQVALAGLLQSVVPKINAFTQLLDLRVGQSPDFPKILAAGCLELVQLTTQPGRTEVAGLATPTPPPDPAGATLVYARPSANRLPAFRPEYVHRLPPGGCLLDGYELRDVLGRGGMGVVFRAFEPSLNRDVAIKMLTSGGQDPAAHARFLREARSAAAIHHENVVTIYAVRETPAGAYLAMEYVAGRSLQQLVAGGGPLAPADIVTLTRQTAIGLAAAHAKGIVHRDIKPANILVEDGTRRVKLTDFGLARAGSDAQLSQDGAIIGTPAYMAPEQALGQGQGPAGDLFSLGGVMYFLATGRPPFDGPTLMAVLAALCNTEPAPPRRFRPDLPAWLDAVIMRLLSKEPAARFASAGELVQVLADGSDPSKTRISSRFRRWWTK